jgi:hypothetical protein
MSTLLFRFNENFFIHSTRVYHSTFNDDENEFENDDARNDETQMTHQNKFQEIFEEYKNVIEKKSCEKSFDFESLNDQNNVAIKSKESDDNVDKRRVSSNNSSNSSSELFSLKKKIDSSTTSQRRVVSKSLIDSKFSFDFQRSLRCSSQTSFEKKKTIDFERRWQRWIVVKTSSLSRFLIEFFVFFLSDNYVFSLKI